MLCGYSALGTRDGKHWFVSNFYTKVPIFDALNDIFAFKKSDEEG